MSRTRIVFAALLLAAAGACTRVREDAPVEPKKEQEAAPQQPAQPETTAAQPARTAEAPAPATTRAPERRPRSTPQGRTGRVVEHEAPVPATPRPPAEPPLERPAPSRPVVVAPPPEPPKPRSAVVPSGTAIAVRLTDSLDSGKNRSGDAFEAILDHDLEVDGVVVAPAGSAVAGKLVNVVESGRVEGRASMTLTLTELRVRGDAHPINTNTVSFEAESGKKRDALKVGGAAGIGAAIGAIAGGGKGAAIGAAIGAAAGTGGVLATRGKQVELASEQRLNFKLDSAVRLPISR